MNIVMSDYGDWVDKWLKDDIKHYCKYCGAELKNNSQYEFCGYGCEKNYWEDQGFEREYNDMKDGFTTG